MQKKTKKISEFKVANLMLALNTLDEFASYATQDNDNGEAQVQAKAYKLLADFILK